MRMMPAWQYCQDKHNVHEVIVPRLIIVTTCPSIDLVRENEFMGIWENGIVRDEKSLLVSQMTSFTRPNQRSGVTTQYWASISVSMSRAMYWASTGHPKRRPRSSLLWRCLEPGKGDGGVSGNSEGWSLRQMHLTQVRKRAEKTQEDLWRRWPLSWVLKDQ